MGAIWLCMFVGTAAYAQHISGSWSLTSGALAFRSFAAAMNAVAKIDRRTAQEIVCLPNRGIDVSMVECAKYLDALLARHEALLAADIEDAEYLVCGDKGGRPDGDQIIARMNYLDGAMAFNAELEYGRMLQVMTPHYQREFREMLERDVKPGMTQIGQIAWDAANIDYYLRLYCTGLHVEEGGGSQDAGQRGE